MIARRSFFTLLAGAAVAAAAGPLEALAQGRTPIQWPPRPPRPKPPPPPPPPREPPPPPPVKRYW